MTNKIFSLCFTAYALAFFATSTVKASEYTEMPSTAPELRPYLPENNNQSDVMPPLAPQILNWQNNIGTSFPSQQIRVGLALNTSSAQISSPNNIVLKDKTSGKIIARLPANNSWRIAGSGGEQISFLESSASPSPYKEVGYLAGPVGMSANFPVNTITQLIKKFTLPTNRKSYAIEPESSDSIVSLNNKLYRGSFSIYTYPGKNTFSIINNVNLEDYLKSVVPSEMPSSWSREALKAQSIAARSYALANLGKHGSDGYDVKSNIEDQVYSGIASEAESSNISVNETSGIVIKHNGKIVSAYFHSTSGGVTELAENVWNSALPYIKSVVDIDSASPYANWTRSFNPDQLESNFKKFNKDVGSIVNVLPVSFTLSGRANYVLISGSQNTLLLTGEELRHILNLPSTLFTLKTDQDSYSFVGKGFGHGLGLSQWGAKALAEQGYNAEQILSYYYKDITVERY